MRHSWRGVDGNVKTFTRETIVWWRAPFACCMCLAFNDLRQACAPVMAATLHHRLAHLLRGNRADRVWFRPVGIRV